VFEPVYSRISSPLQVLPEHPCYVFAPFDGIVKMVFVRPGQIVKKSGLIFSYDSRILRGKKMSQSQQQLPQRQNFLDWKAHPI